MSEYTEQAKQFLTRHNLKFRAVYLDYRPYFADDTESRAIYRCTISGKGRGRYSCQFGASINMTLDNTPPSAYDLLACITKYDPEDFETFCSELGYDTDSRRAHRDWLAVRRDWAKVEKFFEADEIEEMKEIS